MAEDLLAVDSIDNRYYRRAGITAAVYAVVDLLILIFGGPFVPLRLIGVLAAYFVVRDMIGLRDAGVEWGWTRYLVLVLVAIGGFLGFIVYAWRRYSHIDAQSESGAEDESASLGESEEADDGDEDTGTDDEREVGPDETERD